MNVKNQPVRNMKKLVISIIIGTLGTVTKGLGRDLRTWM